MPSPISEPEIAKLRVHRRTLRPNFLNKMIVGKTETQFTTPTRAVIYVAFNESVYKIVLE
jgi:hypothetical protein